MFGIRYEYGFGWVIYKDGKMWLDLGFDSEWDAIESLAETEPEASQELRELHMMVS